MNLNISSLVQPSIAIHGVRQQDHIVWIKEAKLQK